jgi:hypothetical protein
MNRPAFVSINRMRAGHINLKASLNRFNIVSTAECECGDGLQTEEHMFWDCKLYEDQLPEGGQVRLKHVAVNVILMLF